MTGPGRPRTLKIDDSQILCNIARIERTTHDELRQEVGEAQSRHDRREPGDFGKSWIALVEARKALEWFETYWLQYDPEQFAGRQLTDSERKTVGARIRTMHAGGLVQLDGPPARYIRMTEEGFHRVAELETIAKDAMP